MKAGLAEGKGEIFYSFVGSRKEHLVENTRDGLYCSEGRFYIDPHRPKGRAVITHGHSDHARIGADSYLCSDPSLPILKVRLGAKSVIESLPFGVKKQVGNVQISFHPAGHILGSAQVRIEGKHEICVITGDHNISQRHSACEAFEPVPCDTFITECTFGLPIYQWPDENATYEKILAWWKRNQDRGVTCILPTYPLGKTQRLLSGLSGREIGPVGLYGAGRDFLDIYRAAGIRLAECQVIQKENWKTFESGGLLLMSMGGNEPAWLERFKETSLASASGWMQTRGARRGRSLDEGFVLSDHSDWPGLLRSIKLSGASRIGVMHGDTDVFGRYVEEVMGLEVWRIQHASGFQRASDSSSE